MYCFFAETVRYVFLMQEKVWLRWSIRTLIVVFLGVLLHYVNLPTNVASMAPSAVWLLTLPLMFCYFLFAEIVRAMTHVINQGMSMYWGTSRWSAMEIMVSQYSHVSWKDEIKTTYIVWLAYMTYMLGLTICTHIVYTCSYIVGKLCHKTLETSNSSGERDNMARSQLHQKLFWPEFLFFLNVKMQQKSSVIRMLITNVEHICILFCFFHNAVLTVLNLQKKYPVHTAEGANKIQNMFVM